MNSGKIKVFTITFWLVALLLTACGLLPSDNRQCPIEDLLINSSDLPGDQWEEVGSRSYRDAPSRLGNERIGAGFSTPRDGIAKENVYRFGGESDAISGYINLADLWHRLVPEGTIWSELDLPENITVTADEYRIECSVSTRQSLRTCWYIARYDTTVIEFRTAMIIVSDNDFFDVIQTLDLKMMNCEEVQGE